MVRWILRFAMLAVVVAALVVPLTGAAHPADAPARWPGDVVRVSDTSGWGATVRRAIEQWNAAQVGVRFQLVGAAQAADVHVISDRDRLLEYCESRGCDAFTSTVGPSKHDRRTDVVLDQPIGYEDHQPTASDVRLVVHELGHALGLEHDQSVRCAVMQPNVTLAGCGERGGYSGEGPSLCGPFISDVRKASKLYGGLGVPREYCVSPLSR